MPNIAFIGSCLSALVVDEVMKQRADICLTATMSHMRLDVLANFLIDAEPVGAPHEVGIKLVKSSAANLKERNLRRILAQTTEKLLAVREWLQRIDCLVVDNHYDLRASFLEFMIDGRPYRFVNYLTTPDLRPSKDLGQMPVERANEIYQRLFDFILSLNPDLRIVFLQFPVSGYEAAGQSPRRVERARQTAANLNLKDVLVVPLLKVDAAHLSSRGPQYFSPEVYGAYAEAVTNYLDGRKIEYPQGLEVPFEFLQSQQPRVKGDLCLLETPLHTHPYSGLPPRNFWKPAVGDRYPLAISGLYDKKYAISQADRIATFGSCFAQHIGRRLKANGFGFMDVEPAPASLAKDQHTNNGYGIYSGRYGNVYTSTQLLQLLQRATGEISFDEVWESDGRFYDPFRPNLQPDGFASGADVLAAQKQHLKRVRKLFEDLDVLIFTMGLTECWYNAQTSAAYPICPGVTVGRFDPAVHQFKNLTFSEIMSDMMAFIDRLKRINPKFRMLLTVSPVPLTATAEDRHVLVSTMHSKSTLRAAAGELAAGHDFIDYFPSYEIVASPPFRAMFFENNLRTVHDEGVDFVMTHFFSEHSPVRRKNRGAQEAAEDNEDFCDEVFLDMERKIRPA